MRWNDRVYGEVAIDDPEILALIDCPTFQRLDGDPPGGPVGVRLPVQDGDPLRAQPGRLPPAAAASAPTAASRSPGCSTTSRTRRSRTRSTSSSRPTSRTTTSGSSRVPRPPRPRRGARPTGLRARATSTTTRSTRCSNARSPGSAPTGSTTSSATAWPAASSTPEEVGADPRPPDGRRRTIVFDRRRRRPRGRRAVRRDEPRLVGQPDRGLHLQRVRRRPARGLPPRGPSTKTTCSATTPTSWPGSQPPHSPLIAEKLDHILDFRPERIDGYVPRVIPKIRWLDPPVQVDRVRTAFGTTSPSCGNGDDHD